LALKIIESQNFKRTICKTIQKYFGPGVISYGGRKEYPDLMFDQKINL
jgi:hypothetical protein